MSTNIREACISVPLCMMTFILAVKGFSTFGKKKNFYRNREATKYFFLNRLYDTVTVTNSISERTKLKVFIFHPERLQGPVHCVFPCDEIGHIPFTLDIYTGFSIMIHIYTERLGAYKLVYSLRICSTYSRLPFTEIHQ